MLVTGTKLGPYEIVSLLGSGGMGEVYRALDTRLDRTVAIKVIPASHSTDGARRQRFEREARAISALQHPNICTLYDVGQHDGIDYLVMEYLDGETLSSRLARGRLSVDQVLTYGIEISDALDAAQRRGIIHRDLKPGNIFMTSHGECKVLDFGLAKLEDDEAPDAETLTQPDVLTSPGIAVGTVAYMSPEQARGEPLDARTDIFSLGTVLYEMATGNVPFIGKTSAVVFKAILDATPLPPSEVNHAIPSRLDEVIGKCLEKDRDLRYQSAAEVRSDLKRIRRDSASQRTAATGPEPVATSRVVWRVTALLLVAIAAGFGLAFKKLIARRSAHFDVQGMRMTRLTEIGKVWTGAISPDGRYVAYSLQQPPYGLWVRQVSAESSVQVISGATEAIRRPTFSPDGAYLYYVCGGKGYGVPLLGGTPRLLIGETMGGIAVSPNGEQLAYFLGGGDVASQLFVVNRNGTGKHLVAEHPLSSGINFLNGAAPSWSPDGKHIAMVVSEKEGTFLNIYPAEGGAPTTVPVPPWSVQGPWLPDDGAILLTISRNFNGPSQIWAQPLPKGNLQRLTNDLDGYYSLSITKDGSLLAAIQVQDLYTVYVAPGFEPDRGVAIRSGKSDGTGLVWMPDGKLVLQNLDSEFSLLTEDGKNKVSLFKDNVMPGRFSVCRDGHVVFAKDGSIWRTDAGGENMKQLTTDKWDGFPDYPDCSPDSRFVIFTTGANLVRVPIDGGSPVLLSKNDGSVPRYSPDGREIAEIEGGENNTNLIVRDAQTGQTTKSISMPEGYFTPWGSTGVLRWTPDGRALTCLLWKGVNSATNIWVKSLAGGPARQLTHVPDEIVAYDWSPDGKRLAYTRSTPSQDVVIISNFH